MPIEQISINKFDLSFYQDEWKPCLPGNANEMKMAAELVEEKRMRDYRPHAKTAASAAVTVCYALLPSQPPVWVGMFNR